MEITKTLLRNYLPYAKGIIIGRAIPSIDGLKPSQRKILYTMYLMKLLKEDKTKSTNIVGQTMRLHPHGDQTIYDTLVHLTTGNETLNVPYIESKGNFGKVYSNDLKYAASRYTEAKLSKICEEIFDGIDENAVEFINNYDDTMLEPTLLPVKFPTILTNPSNGIAVGMGSSIPSFGLINVCSSVIGILKGKIKDANDLVSTLGIPEFTTGGNVHIDRATMAKLAESGKGSIVMTGTTTTYPDRIVITEIPYKVTAETIVNSIEEHAKSGELKEVASVDDEIDLHGFKLTVNLKRGVNSQSVLQKIMRLTPLRTQVSFDTKVIINDECVDRGLLELLQDWIEFRVECLNRIYTFRYNKSKAKEYMLESWEKIKLDIREVARLIADRTEEEAKESIMSNWKLESDQADYILDMKMREFTKDKLLKRLKELDDVRAEMNEYDKIINSVQEKYKIIIADQERIIKNYGKNNRTHIAPVIDFEKEKEEATVVEIDNDPVTVIVTRNGLMKRLTSIRDMASYTLPEGEEEWFKFNTRNSEHLLVFTYDGTVYKVLVNGIDASRARMHENIAETIGINIKQIMFIDASGDYSKHFNVVYPNGRGAMIGYSRAIGKRAKYKSLFDEAEPGKIWWTFSDQFFMVTNRRKASYCDLTKLLDKTRSAFKVARVSTGDSILALLDIKSVPDINEIDISKYNKEYTVAIGEDELWPGARASYERMMALKEAKKAAKAKENKKDETKN